MLKGIVDFVALFPSSETGETHLRAIVMWQLRLRLWWLWLWSRRFQVYRLCLMNAKNKRKVQLSIVKEKSVETLTCIWVDRRRCNTTMEKTMVLSFVAIF